MNITAPSSILPPALAGGNVASSERGEPTVVKGVEGQSEADFAVHLLTQGEGEQPSAPAKTPTALAFAEDEIGNASAEPRLASRFSMYDNDQAPASDENGRALPPDLAARLKNAGSPALVGTPQVATGRALIADLSAGEAATQAPTSPIEQAEAAERGVDEAPLVPVVEANALGSKGLAASAPLPAKSQSGLSAEGTGSLVVPALAQARPDAARRDFDPAAEPKQLVGRDIAAGGQILTLPADALTRAKVSGGAPVRQTNVLKTEGRRPSAPGTLPSLELAEGAPDERVARLSDQSAQSPTSATGLPTAAVSTPSNPVAANPAAGLAMGPVVNAPQPVTQTTVANPLALDQLVEQIADAREAGRSVRPELSVRTNDFGTIAMRLEASSNDWRATLSARDPGFVPAVQAALAERTVAAASESSFSQHNSSQRGDSQSPSGSQTSGGFGASHSGSEQRYGSSTGSAQGSAQPYLGEEGSGGTDTTAADQDAPQASASTQAADGARFA